MAKKKMTKTGRYVAEAHAVIEKHISHPFPTPPPNRHSIARLAVHWRPEIRGVTTAELAAAINNTLKDAIIIPDTNFFTRPMDQPVWDAIFCRRLAITPMVWQELGGGTNPWRTTMLCCNSGVRDHLDYIGSDKLIHLRPIYYWVHGYLCSVCHNEF